MTIHSADFRILICLVDYFPIRKTSVGYVIELGHLIGTEWMLNWHFGTKRRSVVQIHLPVNSEWFWWAINGN